MNPAQPICLRHAAAADLPAIAAIQFASAQASQWKPVDYLAYDCIVAAVQDQVAGFAVARRTAHGAEGESELLNLAVDPAWRRRGIGIRLLAEIASQHPGSLWLEVRESNLAARKLYKTFGFTEAGKRYDYYSESGEAAIVMNFHS